jgi:CRP-like cAMP-binding protein
VGGKTKFGSPVGGEEDVQALHRFGTKIRVPRGETIFNHGDPAEYAYKVVSGAVRLCRHLSDGRRQIAQFLFPGDFFNFMASGEHSFTAEAVSDAVLMSFPQRQLLKLREERASVQERFMTLLSQRVFDAQNHLMVLGRQTATERVASFLVLLWQRIGDEEDDLVDVPMSRLDIADYLGLTIETVCRVLSNMKRKRIIDVPNLRQLALRDIDCLQALADGAD